MKNKEIKVELQKLADIAGDIWKLRKESKDINRIDSDLLYLNKKILELKNKITNRE